jgi:outer membrane protein OmpU
MKESIMTNMKKLGLTALAGSLAATSAFAGALDVSGTAKVTYVSQDESEVSGNPYSMNQGIGFSGSGDLDNGMSIAYQYTMTNAAFSSSSLKLDMGDSGTLSLSNGAGTTGISAYDDVMPTAGEEVWDDLDGEANGVASISSANTIGWAGTFSGIGLSASYNKNAGANLHGSSKSLVVSSSELMDGFDVGIGMGDKAGASSHAGTDLTTAYAKYTMGSITAGLQLTEIDVTALNGDADRTHVSISMAINENLSASIGQSVVEFENPSKDDQENTGFAVSYTMGSMTIAAFNNSEKSTSGTAGTDDSVTEVSVAFAF